MMFLVGNNATEGTGAVEALCLRTNGNAGIGPVFSQATNARLAISEGHLQSYQASPPTNGVTTGGYMGSLVNATDVAGNINVTVVSGSAGTVTFNFARPYSTPPIIMLTATNSAAAGIYGLFWVTSTTNDFTINFRTYAYPILALTFAYHAIETQ